MYNNDGCTVLGVLQLLPYQKQAEIGNERVTQPPLSPPVLRNPAWKKVGVHLEISGSSYSQKQQLIFML